MTAITAAASAVGELWREIVEAETFLLINLYEWLGEIKRSFFETNTESISFRVVLSFLVCVSYSLNSMNRSPFDCWLFVYWSVCLFLRMIHSLHHRTHQRTMKTPFKHPAFCFGYHMKDSLLIYEARQSK